jgi:hypothetical protein
VLKRKLLTELTPTTLSAEDPFVKKEFAGKEKNYLSSIWGGWKSTYLTSANIHTDIRINC